MNWNFSDPSVAEGCDTVQPSVQPALVAWIVRGVALKHNFK